MSFARTGQVAMQNYIAANDAVAANSWDPNTLIKESIKARSAEKQAMANKDASADIAESNKRGYIARVQSKLDTQQTALDMKKTQRKAGIIAAAGQTIATGLIKTPDPKKPYQSNIESIYKEHGEKLEARLAEQQAKQTAFNEAGPQYTELPSSVTGADPTSTTPSTLSPVSTSSSFSPQAVAGLAAIRKVEAGGFGYNAYNLGGKTEFEPIGSGSAADGKQFGKPLTSMTIGEIDQLGQSGKIHATGGYQFTHNTGSFREAVQFAGLKDTDIFTPANQDKMGYEFGKKYGWQRWSGLKINPTERDAAILGFQN